MPLRPPCRQGQNTVLANQSTIPQQIAEATLRRRGIDYAGEVRRLLDAGLVVMARCGTDARPRVADIVHEAGLSNDAFYRHFGSKDALVLAILDDGTERLSGYLAHQMAKATGAEDAVRRWVAGVLSQADGPTAATTLAVLWNGGATTEGMAGRHVAELAPLLVEPFAALGSQDPEGDATLAAHAALGRLTDLLWTRQPPTDEDVDRVTAFCLRAAR
jgi:AcrR family transcriptional regulator